MHYNKKEQKINEFCAKGLENYRDIITSIFAQIEESGCNISARYDGGPCLHEYTNTNGQCGIRISFQRQYEDPLEIIWIILHEFGHHLSGPLDSKERSNLQLRIERENLAWEKAEKMLATYPNLIKLKSNFDNYEKQCMETYNTNWG